MPRFFIDTHDGGGLVEDADGAVFASVGDARIAAVARLPDISEPLLTDGAPRTYQVIVRGEDGAPLYVATLAFHGEWQDRR